ncbi:MAG: hypothetical protein R3E56_18915 [Burkholderiaceae bacterium]
MGSIVQCSRLSDARSRLEFSAYDLVICEQYFDKESQTGQDLLDDLRRNQLLPFYTVFVMVTSRPLLQQGGRSRRSRPWMPTCSNRTPRQAWPSASTSPVTASSPCTTSSPPSAEDFDKATEICKKRFEASKARTARMPPASAPSSCCGSAGYPKPSLYEAVVEAKTLPWAKLGVARSQLEAGFPQRAETTLKGLIETEPGFSDAYDVMGRAQFELGNFEGALDTFRMATKLTPSSVNRLLKHGMLAYYTGDRTKGWRCSDRATCIGPNSKLYDPQALILLAFARLDENDSRGLTRCVDRLLHLRERQPDSARLERLYDVAGRLVGHSGVSDRARAR